MDAIKNAIGGKSGQSTNQQSNQQSSNQQSGGAGQKQDYGDKAFKAANDKAGWGLDDSKREKASDLGRSTYEKATGSKVDPKYSN